MTVLAAIKNACTVIGLSVPDGVYSSADREYVELAALANEMAARIAGAHEWQALATLATITGDDVTEDFDLPSDYDRMLLKAKLWTSSLGTTLTHIHDLDEWLGLEVQAFSAVINAWTLYGGKLHVKPALSSGTTAKFYYQSNNIVRNVGGTYQASFMADTDSFRLSERLLTLGIIWQWRANKGLPYAEDLTTFEEEKEKLIGRDKGSRIISVGRVRLPADVNIAWPGTIQP